MYPVQSILNLPPSSLRKLLTITKKKDVVDLLQLLFDLGLTDREFGDHDTLRELVALTDEELFEELPDFIIESNPTRGEAIVFQYNSETWYSRQLGMPITVNGVRFPFVDYVDDKSPIAYFVGNQQEVILSKKNFAKFKRELEKISEANLKSRDARKKVDIKNIPKVRSVPVFWSASVRGSDKYIQEYEAYKNLVNEYFRFISWEKTVEDYEEEHREYCEFVFDSAVGKVHAKNKAIIRLKNFFLSYARGSKLAVVVREICSKDSSYTKVCTMKICARDYRKGTKGSVIEIDGIRPKDNLSTLLERFEEGECKFDNFAKDLFYYIIYNFLKSGEYTKLSPEDFPNFYRKEC